MKFVQYIMLFILLTTLGMLYDRYKRKFFPDEELDKYDLVRKFLLNESNSKSGKPLLWIHTTHKINARKWESFYSRNTMRLNQPYIDMCVESVVKYCGESFNICLIDDDSFERLLPKWSIILSDLSDPIKTHVRELCICKLLHEYGGLIIPNSTIVLKDLKDLYSGKLKEKEFFVGEFANRSNSNMYSRFFPSNKFMCCKKGNSAMKELISNLEISVSGDNSDQPEFEGTTDKYIYKLVKEGKCGLVCGKALGTKDKNNNVVLIDALLNEAPLNLCFCSLYCICLPGKEILHRTKYNWFARLSHRQVLEGNTQVSKFLLLCHGK